MIRELNIKGLKVESASATLSDRVLIRGPVGSGKSAIADAIQFAALGTIPRIGKSADVLSRGINGSEAVVVASLVDGRQFSRSLARGARAGAKWQSDASASWLPAKSGLRETEEQIRSLYGASESEASENLDISRLLAVSGAELAKRVEVLLASGSRVDHDERARTLFAGRSETLREKVDGILQPLSPSLEKACADVLDAFLAALKAGVVPALEGAKLAKLDQGDKARRSGAAASALEDRIVALKAPAESLPALRKRLDDARLEAAGIRSALKVYQDADKAKREAAETLARAVERQAAVGARIAEIPSLSSRAAAARAEAAEIQEPPAIPPPSMVEPDLGDLASSLAALEAAAMKAGPRPLGLNIDPWKQRVAQTESQIGAARLSPWRWVEDLAKQLDVMTRPVTPLGRTFEEIRSALSQEHVQSLLDAGDILDDIHAQLHELAKLHVGDLAGLEASLESARVELAEKQALAEAAAKAGAEWDRANADRVVLMSEIRTQREATASAFAAKNRRARDAYTAAVEAARVERIRVAEQRRSLLATAELLEGHVRSYEAQKASADAEVTAAQARLSGLRDAIEMDVAAASDRIAVLDDLAKDLSGLIATARDADARRDELRRLRSDVEAASALRDAWAVAEWVAARLRDAEMTERSSGIESRLQKFLRAAGRTETPYMRCERGTCEFGWKTAAGKEVSIEFLSGGQSVIYSAALAYSVLSLRNPAERVLLVELAEACDGTTETQLLAGLASISDEVQVVASTCVPIEAPEVWQVIDVAAQPSEVVAE